MKTLQAIFVVIAVAWLFSHKPRPDPRKERREQIETAIREHRLLLGMTQEDVARSFGPPDGKMTTQDGNTVLGWESGRWVMFSGRVLLDSGYFDAHGDITHDPSKQTAIAAVPMRKPRGDDWMKKFGNTIPDRGRQNAR